MLPDSAAYGAWSVHCLGCDCVSILALSGLEQILRPSREETYFEIDVDIGSSYAACSVVNLVKGATKSMVIDFGVLIEGKAEDELPERLIGVPAGASLFSNCTPAGIRRCCKQTLGAMSGSWISRS